MSPLCVFFFPYSFRAIEKNMAVGDIVNLSVICFANTGEVNSVSDGHFLFALISPPLPPLLKGGCPEGTGGGFIFKTSPTAIFHLYQSLPFLRLASLACMRSTSQKSIADGSYFWGVTERGRWHLRSK